jgi:hypothetical protein
VVNFRFHLDQNSPVDSEKNNCRLDLKAVRFIVFMGMEIQSQSTAGGINALMIRFHLDLKSASNDFERDW